MSHLYAVEFSIGLIKIGRGNAETRIKAHADRLSVAGITVVRSHARLCESDEVAAETSVLRRCREHADECRSSEWFTGLDFDSVCRWIDEAIDAAPLGVQREASALAVWLDAEKGRRVHMAKHFGLTKASVSHWINHGVPLRRMADVVAYTAGAVDLDGLVGQRLGVIGR